MASAVTWLGTLTRLQLRALYRVCLGKRVPVLTEPPPLPDRSWQRAELRVARKQRRIEFAFRVPGAEADSTRVYWDEENETLTVHVTAASPNSLSSTRERGITAGGGWYREVPVASDVDGKRAEAFLEADTLRVVAPLVSSKPLTGLPLLAWTNECSNGSLAAAT
jgi:HSP20 family molecular chaperone IbpA